MRSKVRFLLAPRPPPARPGDRQAGPGNSLGTPLDEQLELIWANIATIVASAGLSLADVVRVTSYLRDVSYAEANARARLRALDGRRVPTTAIVAETLVSDWLVEIEVIAAA